ncbi:MAG: arginyltransferase [Rhodospirillales bacterium RIFCSPLOWO2_12_FULL_67_15]|nr:MAG: arginyltransferase [Rhodospirillales bacterium RIFCSPLOWO2_12_FULL_67_15]
MKLKPIQDARFFFATSPLACPYLEGKMERRVVAELVGRDAAALHDALTHAGFRRSHAIVYAPACTGCDACIPVRIVARDFRRSRTQARIWRSGMAAHGIEERPPIATREQFALFVRYQQSRHAEGDMARMDFEDYRALIEDTPVDTVMIEVRAVPPVGGPMTESPGALVAACLADRVGDGLSAVYSFFEPEHDKDSLGTLMILWLVERARAMGKPYVYLGFWIAACRKMSYKSNFRPIEARTNRGWKLLPKF